MWRYVKKLQRTDLGHREKISHGRTRYRLKTDIVTEAHVHRCKSQSKFLVVARLRAIEQRIGRPET